MALHTSWYERLARLGALLVCVTIVSACGGGGGSAANNSGTGDGSAAGNGSGSGSNTGGSGSGGSSGAGSSGSSGGSSGAGNSGSSGSSSGAGSSGSSGSSGGAGSSGGSSGSSTTASTCTSTNTAVTCPPWTWASGSIFTGANGVYNTQGQPGASNVPGARSGAVSWSDASGNLWLFGGQGEDSVGNNAQPLNDLWQYNHSQKQWTWMSGSNTYGALPVYGTQGVPAATNVPGARSGAASWMDASGNLWLFGGFQQAAGVLNPPDQLLNDLWEYSPTSKEWTWVSGSSAANANGSYGTLGQGATQNAPGARFGAVTWIDAAGNLWLFGGYGWDASSGTPNILNDLWEYSPTQKKWTWSSGSSTAGASGMYGTQGTPGADNVPGARTGATSWIDASGNLWLFGGCQVAATAVNTPLTFFNDLWTYSPTSRQWTWVGGSTAVNAHGTYGAQGMLGAANAPGSRTGAVAWKDASGNFWLFGGFGEDSGQSDFYGGYLNDLWVYNSSSKQWTWVSGSDLIDAGGVYGTQGSPAATNQPGARSGAVAWTDTSGNVWLFGGFGLAGTGSGSDGYLNDLWMD